MKPKNTNILRFVWYFYQEMMYQKSEWYFFDQGSIDGKSEVEKRHLVAELKLKMPHMQNSSYFMFFILSSTIHCCRASAGP